MSIILDGLSVSALGLPRSSYGPKAFEISGWLKGPRVERGATGIPGLYGALPDTTAIGQPRPITCSWRWKTGDITDRPAVIAILREATQGERRFTTIDRPREFTRVHCVDFHEVTTISPARAMVNIPLEIRVSFVAYDGVSYDVEPRTLVIGATPTSVRIGTAPSNGILYVSGALAAGVTRTVRYTGINGREYAACAIRPPLAGEITGGSDESLAATDHIELDGLQRSVTKVLANGTRSNAEHWFSGAWFAIDPKHAARGMGSIDPTNTNRTVGAFPRLAISSGVGVFIYHQAWML